MTVIYVDTLFLLNAVVDYLLLLAAARLAGEPLKRLRFGAGAVLGGLYAVAIFLPGMAFLSHPICRIASAVLMLLAAYGGSRRLLRQGIIFFALTCAFGGGVVAIGLLGRQGLALGNSGVFYSSLDLKIVLLSAAVCYIVLTITFQRVGRHSTLSGELLPTRLVLGERAVELTTLVDTGNTLTDPVSGRPVMVAEGESLEDLFPGEYRPGPADLRDPTGAITRLGTGAWKGRFCLLPYRAVGVDRGLLLALRVDRITLGGKDRGPFLVALSPTPVSDGGGYRALVGPLEGTGQKGRI
ncbi:MAG: sigma-E processing peptidase SpoIIGA [Lawsonibacter sp.]